MWSLPDWTRSGRAVGLERIEITARLTNSPKTQKSVWPKNYAKLASKSRKLERRIRARRRWYGMEDLRHDTNNAMKAMYAALEVEAAVKNHSWENIPESEKGKDKSFRKAQPGSWRDDLSPGKIKLIESITGPILSKYYLAVCDDTDPCKLCLHEHSRGCFK
jgi:hypothetical protein